MSWITAGLLLLAGAALATWITRYTRLTNARILRLSQTLNARATALEARGGEFAKAKTVDWLGRRLEKLLRLSSASNSMSFQHHSRFLSDASATDVVERLCPALGLHHTGQTLSYLAHKICVLEDACMGRLGTSIETAIVRLLVTQSLLGDLDRRIDLVEIGTLFGIAAGAIDIGCRHLGGDLRLTLIDPLSGYYGKGEPDPVTGLPVDRRTLETNLRTIGCAERTTILQGLSDDPAVLNAVAPGGIDVLIIDGDHTRDGVERDYRLYKDRIRPGGFVVFDDYAVKEWPDVKSFFDSVVADDPAFVVVYKGQRSALVRRNAVVAG